MATLELDPLLKKGLRLLHSRSKDSVDQLKILLDEAHRQRQGKSLSNIKDPFNLRRESPIPRSKQSSPSNITLSKGGDLKRDLSHKGSDDPLTLAPKRPKLDSPHNPFKSHTPSPTPSIKSESSSRSRKSDESDSDADMNELATEIGINCTVCKSFEQTSGNQLVECQECHSLFHQECHKPSVSHQDMTDPRLVWYCSKCSRNLKKQSSLVTSSSSSSLSGIRSSSSVSSSKNLGSLSASSSRPSPSKGVGMQRPSPFANLSSVTRSNIGSNSGSGSNSGGSSSVSSATTRSSISSSSARSNASAPPAANSLLNAERRVHLMKKKAAAKNAERRKL